MPCHDIRDSLSLVIDSKERIVSFDLAKMTCGAPVGEALLLPYLRGATLESLLTLPLPNWLPEINELEESSQFVLDKQFFALQAAAAVITGKVKGHFDDTFFIESCDYDGSATTIRGLLKIDLDPAKIKACTRCCSQPKKERHPAHPAV